MFLPMLASADAVEINGIYYNLVSKAKTAEVTSNPYRYTGDVVIPESITYEGTEYTVTSIGDDSFASCYNMTSVLIPNGITSIGIRAFEFCKSLTSITIPNSVISIKDYAFRGCQKLTSVIIPNSVTIIGYCVFSDCSALTSVNIPNSVTIIDAQAFARCTSLSTLTIPNSVTTIYGLAFANCSALTSITIGSGMKRIYDKAFSSCLEIKDVYCYAENVPSTNIDVFDGSYIDFVNLHVPEASIASYKNTAPWSGFGSIVGLNGESWPKCATPVINYNNGKINFICETEGVEFVSELTNADTSKNYTNEISVSGKYLVKVYATKEGYQDSDTATEEFQLSASSSVEPGGSTEEGKKGDLNGDNVVNAADMVALVNIIMGEGAGGDNPPISGDDSEVTSNISAYYAGGAINKINNTIQSGSQLLWGFKNGSSVSVTIIGAVLINGVTGSESDNLLPEPLEVAAGETKGLTTTIGVLGIQEPKIRFTYKYNQKEYSVEADYKDFY